MTLKFLTFTGLLVAVCVLSGCSQPGPETFPVSGKIVVKGGGVAPFVGNVITFRLESDPNITSHGIIQNDGSFTLKSVYAAKTQPGVVAGVHKGRFPMEIDGSDLEDGSPLKGKRGLHAKYARFETSGWEIQVPVNGEVILTIE